MKKRCAMIITRWTDRAPHPAYKRAVRESSLWEETETDLFIAYHGRSDLDPQAQYESAKSNLFTIDFREESPDGYFPRLVSLSLQYFLDNLTQYDLVGLCDDDGVYTKPAYASARIVDAYDTHKYGAYGPMSPYLAWTRYDNKVGEEHKPILPQNWTTYGSQIFSREYLDESRRDWVALFSTLRYRIDIPLFILADMYSYSMAEMLMSFSHTCSHGTTHQEDVEEWHKRKAEQVSIDWRNTLLFFENHKAGVKYLPVLRLLHQKDLNMLARRVAKMRAGK